jgi:DNA-directed RNA polymerase specialized sigma24 family protein
VDNNEGQRRVLLVVSQLRDDLAKLPPAEAVLLAHQAVETWAAAQPELSGLRRDTITQAQEAGWTNADLAALLGLSRQRIGQLVNGTTTRGPRPRDRTKGGEK